MSLEILRKVSDEHLNSPVQIFCPVPAFHDDVVQAPEASYPSASSCHGCLCLSGPLCPQWDCFSGLSSREVVVFIEKQKGLSPHRAALCEMGPSVACADLSLNLSLSNIHTHTHTHTCRDTHTDTHTQTHTHRDTHTSSFLLSIHMSLCNLESGLSSKKYSVFFSYSLRIFPLLFFRQTLSVPKSGKEKKKKNPFQIVEAQFFSF